MGQKYARIRPKTPKAKNIVRDSTVFVDKTVKQEVTLTTGSILVLIVLMLIISVVVSSFMIDGYTTKADLEIYATLQDLDDMDVPSPGGHSSAQNPFDQTLNTMDSVIFASITGDGSGLTNVINYENTVTVAKSGGDYTTIQSAIDSIIDNANNKRYIVLIYPGTYTENVVMEEYVSLIGLGHEATEITSSSGTTITTPPGASDTMINELKVSSTPTADGANVIVVTAGEVDVYNCYLKMTSSTNGVNGNLVEQTGGDVEFNNCFFKYALTGSSVGVETQSVLAISGTDIYNIYNCEFDVDVSDVDDIVPVINEIAGATITYGDIKNSIFHCNLNSATYSGSAGIFYLHGTGTDKNIENCHIHLESAGNGIGYLFYMDTSAGGGVINAIANRGDCTGFTTNYGGNVAAGDTLNGAFIRLTAANGFTGTGAKNVVSSAAAGDLTVTGSLTAASVKTTDNAGIRTAMLWCEENSAIATSDNGGLEYSWGNGAVGAWGPTQPWAGTIVAMSITVDTDTAEQGAGKVDVAINGVAQGGEYRVGNPGSANGGNSTIFTVPLAFSAGDKITAITTVTPTTTTDVVIAFWIVYD